MYSVFEMPFSQLLTHFQNFVIKSLHVREGVRFNGVTNPGPENSGTIFMSAVIQ
jgi:hypothetical protein